MIPSTGLSWTVTVLVLLMGHRKIATGNDPCEQYTNISDPWRNRGFSSGSSRLWPKNDSDLQEGWYRFTGVGGDTLDYVCFGPAPPKVPGAAAVDHWGLCGHHISNGYPSLFIKRKAMQLCAKTSTGCNSIGDVDVKFCSGGFHVHQLRPTSNQTYATRHYNCKDPSCGERAQCLAGGFGACECEPGYEMAEGVVTMGNTYGCIDPCEQYTNISDPWRNRGFSSGSSRLWPKNDSDLQEGWYRFTGVGGDTLDYVCFGPAPPKVPGAAVVDHWGLCGHHISNGYPSLFIKRKAMQLCAKTSSGCNSIGGVDVKFCSGGFHVHQLKPTRNQTYATRHSNCLDSSCGERAQCGSFGACECEPGYEMAKGVVTMGNAYGCIDPCEQYTNISDPWRNRGFSSGSSRLWPKNDSDLQEGWYRFTGVGGDTLDYVCFGPAPPKVPGAAAVDHWGLCGNHITNGYPSLFIKRKAMQLCAKTSTGCNSIGDVDVKFCSGGFHVHQLRPTSNQTYATRHYNCKDPSCGERAQCLAGGFGACECEPGYEMAEGVVTMGNTYGCIDPCEQYSNISDPWRNRGFSSGSSRLWPKNDSDLQEGWYRFSGVGGDTLDYVCFGPAPPKVPGAAAVDHWGLCGNHITNGYPSLFIKRKAMQLCAKTSSGCNSIGDVDVKFCSGGFHVHQLRPTSNQTYTTRHYNCKDSSCGERAQCGSFGACECEPGYEMAKGVVTMGNTYGCIGPCEQYTNISDPWRNRGFSSGSSRLWPKNDSDLQEGWYRFTGVGGDTLDYVCFGPAPPKVPGAAVVDHWGLCGNHISNGYPSLFIKRKAMQLCAKTSTGCNSIGDVDVKFCSGGFHVHQLRPTSNQTYATRHYNCKDPSCGERAQCLAGGFGACECEPGYEMAEGVVTMGNTYGCIDPCEQYSNISDPWRNRGFSSGSSRLWPKNDSDLQEGWYRFSGVGGDTLDYVCFGPAPPKVPGAAAVDHWGLCGNHITNGYPSLFIKRKAMQLCAKTSSGCNSIGDVDVKFCSGGFHVHQLRPTSNQTYTTRHYNCKDSSCGERAQCGSFGACECEPGYEMAKGVVTMGNTYGCIGPCEQYTNISDPWRNRGFSSGSSRLWPKNDSDLQEGWYRFTGVGGDTLDYVCFGPAPPKVPGAAVVDHWGLCGNHISNGYPSLFIKRKAMQLCAKTSTGCNSIGDVDVKFCSGGFHVHQLRPTSNQTYATRHYNCKDSSCGERAQCLAGGFGACACEPGYELAKGVVTMGDTYGCIGPCEQYTNISDPWRNRGFSSGSSWLWPKNDSDLQEGWYRFTGVGGDTLDYVCFGPAPPKVPGAAVVDHWGLCGNHITNGYPSLSIKRKAMQLCAKTSSGCNSIGDVDVKVCSGGFHVHQLRPTSNQTYATRHSNCMDSSCGEHAQCGSFGDCACEPGYEMAKGVVTMGNTYGCTNTDECTLAVSCPAHANCVNSQGSYHCECVHGYLPQLLPNNTITCKDEQGFGARCKDQLVTECIIDDLTDTINRRKEQELQTNVVIPVLVKLVESLYDLSRHTAVKVETQVQYANRVLRSSEDVVAILVSKDGKLKSHSGFKTSSAELQLIAIGPYSKPRPGVTSLEAFDAQLDIDLYELSKRNEGRASAALLVFTNMEEVLTAARSGGTLASKVVSVSLPKMPTTQLLSPVNLTLRHKKVLHPQGELSCVYWNTSAWVVDGCHVAYTNTTHTVCTCEHLSTFALVMQVEGNLLKIIAMVIGLLFLVLTLFTFALCALNPKVTNVARLNLCITLFQAHLLTLLVQEFILHILPHKVACRVLSGLQTFLFLSGFHWMQLDTLLVLLSIMTLKKLKKARGEGPSCGHLSLICYGIPLVIVGVVFGLMPDGYGTEWCGVQRQGGLSWSLLGPAYFTFIVNLILLLIVVFSFCLLSPKESAVNEEIKNIRCQAVQVFVQSVVIMSPWILGFFWRGSGILDIIFFILTSQQGTFLFLIHCVFNCQVHSHWKKLCQKLGAISQKPVTNM